jgi:GntR family transcriptional regulator/MocR family aminotransferase
MTVGWSTSSPDLLIAVDRAAPAPLRAQLEGQLRDAVRTGRLAAGERLPSSRALARHLGLSRGVVQECFEQLVAEGYLISRGGSATRVAQVASRAPAAPRVAASASVMRLIADFQSGVPDLGLAPREDWAWAIHEVCRTAPNTAFDYGDARGDERLRGVLAAYLRRVRAADTSADRILVCARFQQGLAIVLRTLAADGRTVVAVEDPGSVAVPSPRSALPAAASRSSCCPGPAGVPAPRPAAPAAGTAPAQHPAPPAASRSQRPSPPPQPAAGPAGHAALRNQQTDRAHRA